MSVKANNFKFKHAIEKSPKASPGYLKLLALRLNRKMHQGFNEKQFCEKHSITVHKS